MCAVCRHRSKQDRERSLLLFQHLQADLLLSPAALSCSAKEREMENELSLQFYSYTPEDASLDPKADNVV